MKLASLRGAGRDGRLAVVAPDILTACFVPDIALTMIDALERWHETEPALLLVSDALRVGRGVDAFEFKTGEALAPLPRTYQWLDGSAFSSHGELMARVFGIENPQSERPLMYQGMSHQFLSAYEDVPFRSEADGIDFEGEFGVITDEVPMGTSAQAASAHIKLIVQINDWSLRALAPIEMKTGFGWIQAKPPCSLAPLAITADELGEAWSEARVALPLTVSLNGRPFGAANGREMGVSFQELIAHAAATRSLCAGTLIGSGTVSNHAYRQIGSSCIAERRAIELVDTGAACTPYMRFGDSVRMEAASLDGHPLFGAIEQRVISAGV